MSWVNCVLCRVNSPRFLCWWRPFALLFIHLPSIGWSGLLLFLIEFIEVEMNGIVTTSASLLPRNSILDVNSPTTHSTVILPRPSRGLFPEISLDFASHNETFVQHPSIHPLIRPTAATKWTKKRLLSLKLEYFVAFCCCCGYVPCWISNLTCNWQTLGVLFA